ncbi:MAG TPA: hypothetical protein VHW47_10165 [Acidimicrobiales bacterium]|jgi:hypothetical protein|nr:hypothetical protein [Acidimicrobiales bacterium]
MADRSPLSAGRPAGPVARVLVDGLIAGANAGLFSGLPSTAIALRQGTGPLTAARSAGALLGRPTLPRGLAAHAVLSLGWGMLLACLFDRLARFAGTARVTGATPAGRPTPAGGAGSVRTHPVTGPLLGGAAPGIATAATAGAAVGAVAGAGIAAFDLLVVGRRVAAIRQLPQRPQWLDHLAYGAVAGVTLAIRRAPRASRLAGAAGPAGEGGQK